jgi:hypothetical protein
VDAVVRNQLAEQQLIRRDMLDKIAQASAGKDSPWMPKNPSSGQVTTDRVTQRAVGLWALAGSPAELMGGAACCSIQCCVGNANQGIYYAWEGAVRESGDSAQVNLLLNRSSAGLDVDSYLPYEGRVVIHNRKMRRVSVRIPWWVNRRQLRLRVEGPAGKPAEKRPPEFTGNYLRADDLKPGQRVVLEFPVPTCTQKYTAAPGTPQETLYTFKFRGSTVVEVSPHSSDPTSYPFYLRDHMKAAKAPMKRVKRFVPRRIITEW